MKKIGIFYGSSTGNTEQVAKTIAMELGVDGSDVIDVSRASAGQLSNYDVLLLGSSTWGVGDLQDDWEGFIGSLERQNLSGKEVAVFGTGDAASYPDSFCNALSILAGAARKAGATLVGDGVDPSGYSFEDSTALENDAFCGLPLDVDNEDDKTEGRIKAWIGRIRQEAGI